MASKKRYHTRSLDFVADAAWNRGYLKPLELFQIAAWKTGQGPGSLTLNTEEGITERSAAAMETIRTWRGTKAVSLIDEQWAEWRETSRLAIGAKSDRSGLLGLESVGYPMATAILAVLDSQVWPVIDRWAVQTVFGKDPNGRLWRPRYWQRADAYQVYAQHLAGAGAKSWGSDLSIHKLDQRAMNASKDNESLPDSWSLADMPQLP